MGQVIENKFNETKNQKTTLQDTLENILCEFNNEKDEKVNFVYAHIDLENGKSYAIAIGSIKELAISYHGKKLQENLEKTITETFSEAKKQNPKAKSLLEQIESACKEFNDMYEPTN